MSGRRSSTSPAHQVISPVNYDTERAAPLALKYPAGQLLIALPEHLAFIQRAATETGTPIFIVRNLTRLLVYYTADGMVSSVPETEPTDFFNTFQRLQIEAFQAKRSNSHAI